MMAEAPVQTLLTADNLLAMSEDGVQYELVRGELITMSPSAPKAVIVADRAGRRIGNFVEQHGLGVSGGADFGFRLAHDPDTVRAPDYAFVRAEHVPVDGFAPGFWSVAPDLAVEVLSPSNRPGEIVERVEDYLAASTRLIWVFDPDKRVVHVFHPDRPPQRVLEHGTLSGDDVLPGFELSLDEVWV